MFERFLSKTRAGSQPRIATGAMTAPAIRALEPRFVFDGAAAPTAAQAHGDPTHGDPTHGDPAAGDRAEAGGHKAHAEPVDARAAAPVAPMHETATASGRNEIVVIDKGAADLATLLAGVPSSAEIILIDPARDGFDQLAEALAGRSDIDAIHILSHGSAGDLRLGTGDLTAETIQGRYADDLAVIGNALTATGDLLIYGCDFAAGEAGTRAVALLASATGADIAASDDDTGATDLGGDWNLEVHQGAIETGIVVDEAAQRDWHHLLAAADNGRGALLAVSGRTIYSVDIASGKATALTQASEYVGEIQLSSDLNSLAVDQTNGLIYYVDNSSPHPENKNALFAYDFKNDRHILIDADLSNNGITTGNSGLGGAGAAFSNGVLYLAVENISGTNRDQIYKLTFTGSGRTVASGQTFGNQSNHDYDWGDLGIDPINKHLISLTSVSFARFDLATGNELSFVSGNRTDFQSGFDQGGRVYSVGSNITQLDPNTGAAFGSGKAITTNGSTAIGTISDAASWTPPTSTIGGRVFGDANRNGASDSGENGIRGVTIQLVDDVNGNGRVDAGERVLATDTSAADGSYSFTGLLPGQFVVRVTDTEGRLATATPTTRTSGAVTDSKVGATLAGPNFGYNPAIVLDLDDSAAGTGYATSYTERAAGVAIVDSDVSILDVASTTIASAKAVITNGSGADTLGISGTLPAGISAAYDVATYTLTLTGSASLASYQTALQQIRFSSADRDPATTTRTVSVVVNDRTIDSNTSTSTIAFTAVDDAPVNAVPGAQTVNEDTALVFSSGNGNAVTVSDADVQGGTLTTTLSVAHGTVTLGSTSGVTVSGDGTGRLSVTGTVAGINAALNGTTYRPAPGYNGAETLTVATTDNGNTGTGGPLTDSDDIAITVTAVDDAPVLDLDASAPGTGFRTSYSVGGTAVAIADTDVAVTDVDTAQIASARAVISNHQVDDRLSFVGTPPSGIVASYDAATYTLTLTGAASKADYQTALQQIRYDSTGSNPSTVDRTIAVTVNDGSVDSAAATAIVSLGAASAPVNTVPAGQTVDEDTDLVFSVVRGNAIRVDDADGGTLTVTLSADQGVLSLSGLIGLTFTAGDGANDATMTFSGAIADINAALDGLRFAPRADYNGSARISLVTRDPARDADNFTNGSFESPTIPANNYRIVSETSVPGWKTDASDHEIEIWSTGYNRVPAYEGNQFAEINANRVAALYQTFDAAAGSTITLDFAHRGRAGVDTMEVKVTDLGTDGIAGTADDRTVFDNMYSDGNTAWGAYHEMIGTTASGNTLRFEFRSISAAGGSPSIGNFIDGIQIHQSFATASTVDVAIAPVADIVPDAVATNEDSAITFNAVTGTNGAAADNFKDAARAVTAVTQGAHGTVTFGSDGTLTYTPDAEFNGTDSFTYTVTAGGTTETATETVTVCPVDDAPVLDLDASVSGTGFRTSYDVGGAAVAIADIDVAVTDIDTAQIASARAVITNPQADDGLSFVGTPPSGIVASYDAATSTLTLTGAASKADYQAALQQIRYASTGSAPSMVDRTIAVTVNDGSLDSAAATATVTFNPLNAPPVNALPAGQTLAEDTSLVFSAANGNAVTVSDVDAGGSPLTTTLGVLHGTLTLGSHTGVIVTNDGTGAVTLTGTATAINAALDGTVYHPDADYNGSDTLTLVTTDNGNTGAGGPKTDTDTLSISVTAVNDAPVNRVPGPQILDEDTSLLFSPASGNGITVSDVDAGSGGVTTTLRVQHGTLTLGGTAGVTVAGSGTGTVTLTGTVAAINAALDGTAYRPDTDYDGADTLTILTTDNGNTGAGGPRSDTDTIDLTVNPLNDAPTNAVPAATQTLNEDTPLIFTAGGGNGISVADADGGLLTVTLSSAQGRLTLSQTTGLTFLQGSGAGDGTMRFSGTVAAINAALDGLRFDPAADRNRPAQISLVTVDPAGATATSTIGATILPVADIVPDAVATNEDSALTFNAVTGTNGATADNFEDATRAVTAVTQGAHGTVAFRPDGTLTYTPDADFNGTDSFTYTVTAGGTTETATVTVTVRPINDAPVLDLSATHGYATRYTEGGPGVAIADAGVSVTDIDSATMASATAIVTNGQAGDTLAVAGALPAGITARFDPATFTLTLSGTATKAEYQAALGLVRYSSFERDPSTVTRRIDVSVSDGALRSGVATATIAVTTVNDAPVNGLPAIQTTAEDTPLVFSAASGNAVTISDVDAGGSPLTTTLGVLHGTLTLGSHTGVIVTNDGTGAVTLTGTANAINAALDGTVYRPDADYNGADTLTLVTTDNGNTGAGGPKSDTDTLALTVSPVNDAPRAGTLPAVGSLDGDRVAGLDLGRFFSDVEGETLTFGVAGLPAGLTIDSATGRVSGTIDRSASRGGTNGDYAVTVTADDGHGGTTRRSFTWRVIDPAPIARNDGAVTDARMPALGSVLADNGNGADSDPDGDPLMVAAINRSAAGVGQAVAGSEGGRFTVLADGRYRFDPGADFDDLAPGQTRTTRIDYTIADGDGGTATAALIVTVTGLAEAPAPFAPGDRAAGDGETVTLPSGDPSRSPGGTRYSATGLPPGLAIDPATGTVRGTIDRAASGPTGLVDYRVTVTATGPGGAQTETRFTLRVTNPAPKAMDDAATTAEDRPVVVDVLSNDRDPDGDALAIVATGDAAPRAGHGRVAVVDGTLVYAPDADFNGTDTITYAIADGNGGTSTASVAVTVTPVNDGPSAGALPDQAGRSGAPVTYAIATRFSDPDIDRSAAADPGGDRLLFTATGLPPGLAIDPATGLITGRLPTGSAAVADYTVTITATDTAGASIARSFTWTVSDAATAGPDNATTRAGTPVLVAVTANDVDADGGAVRLVDAPGATNAAHGTVSVDPATGLITYVPEDGFSGTDTVVYTIETAQGVRATGLLTVAVTPVDRPPVAPDTLSPRNAAEGERVRVPFGNLIVDPEGASLAYSATGLPPGLAIDPATGEISGTIARDASGSSGRATYVVTLTAADPNGFSVSRKFAWMIMNPAPIASDDVITTDEDRPVDIDVTGNDGDPDGDPLSVVAGSATARHGTVAINRDGSLRYTPDPDFNGTDTIVYTVTDGQGAFATASVVVGVNPLNDAPVIDAASPALADLSASDAARVAIPAGSAFRDIDDRDVLTFSATGLPPGLALDRATGLISGTIASDASTKAPGGVYTITLTGTDLAGASATTRFTITVENPAPIARDDVATLDEDGVLEGHVLDNDADPDGDAIRVDPVPVAGPLHGRLDLRADGRFTYRPDADFHGADAFTYAVVDSDGGRATATVYLTVAAVDAPPTATAAPVTTREDTPADGRIVAHDREDESLIFSIAVPPASGSVSLRPDGGFTYTPVTDFHGDDGFTVRVTDRAGGSTLVAVPVTVAAVNDAPDAHADDLTIAAGEVGRGRVVATDRDGDPLGFRLSVSPANGTVLLAEDGSYAYTPAAGFSGGDSFTVEVGDGGGGVTRVTVGVTVVANRVLVPPPGTAIPLQGARPLLDPPAGLPAPVSQTGIAADGFLLAAVAAVDPLGTIGKVNLAKGAVLAAVNGVDELRGTAIDIDRQVVLDAGDRIARLAWERFEREADGDSPWFSTRPYLGRSLGLTLSPDESVAGRNDLMIEAIRRSDGLVINLRNPAPDVASVVDVRIFGPDGSPAPAWIEGDGRGGFWGRPPAGTRLVTLEVEVALQGGRVVRWPMTVDAETGEIRATAPTRPGAGQKPVERPGIGLRVEAPLFTARLASLDQGGRPDLTLIETALARAR